MLAAARFSREVGAIENENKGQPWGEFWGGIFHRATACILTSVASLEAHANELFSDRNWTVRRARHHGWQDGHQHSQGRIQGRGTRPAPTIGGPSPARRRRMGGYAARAGREV